MTGLPPSNFDIRGQQQPHTSDSRLLDAAETLVTLQSVSRGQQQSGSTTSKPRPVYLSQHQQRPYKMSPQPPTPSSTSLAAMGPPPPPPPANVTYVLINQAQPSNSQSPNLMRPPTEPPPRRGRGRGRGRGVVAAMSEPTSNRGRGRGRGRGTATRGACSNQLVSSSASQFQDQDLDPDDDPLGEIDANKEAIMKEDTTFMVGNHLELKDSIFDEILNRKKIELLTDPEIMNLFAKQHQKMIKKK